MQGLQRSKSKTRVPSLNIQTQLIQSTSKEIKDKENYPPPAPSSSSSIKDTIKENDLISSASVSRKSKYQSTSILSPLSLNGARGKSFQLGSPKAHRFQKKIFSKPTWCQFANKFIWGLNKSGYECRVCGFAVSRKYISQAKKLCCGQGNDGLVDLSTATHLTKKVFTIYLPHGAKKTVLLNPTEHLRTVLEKICLERGINLNEYVAEDTDGAVIDLDTRLGNINGAEITFTKREPENILTVSSTPNLPVMAAVPSSFISPRDKRHKSSKKSNGRSKSQLTIEKVDPSSSKGPSTPQQKPKKVIDMFEIGAELGSGAFSIVKAATNKETGDEVAIKILDKYEDDDEQTQKFKQEIQIISHLHHDNIVKFYELDEDDENFYVVMELVGGGELFDYIIERGALAERESACIIAQVLKAVEYMHSLGIAHRDLKPENLLFKDSDHKIIKIADFGESKSFSHGPLTTYCGTPDYMSPEIIRGEPYGSAVDIWAIGVITYVMLAGFPPFDGENDVEVFASILSVRYDFPSPEWDCISAEAKSFIQLILNDDVVQRLTATECMNHPWIVNMVPEEMRRNGKVTYEKGGPLTSTNSVRGEEDKSSKATLPKVVELDERRRLIEDLEELKKLAEGSVYQGEVAAMEAIMEATAPAVKNNPSLLLKNSTVPLATTSSELEKVIFMTYQRRVIEIGGFLKKNRKSKKK